MRTQANEVKREAPGSPGKADEISESVLQMERILVQFQQHQILPAVRALRRLRAARARNLRLRRRGVRP